jgi:phosphoglycolate phosphatase
MPSAQHDLVIFDLDGTLIDSKLDLAHAVNATRAWMRLGPLDIETISSYVGNGAPLLIRRVLGPDAPEPDVERALDFFLQYYREHPLDFTTLYPGVRETLEGLSSDGVKLAVLTNKPVRISGVIVEGLGVAQHFFRIYGGNSFEQKKPHPVGIHTLMEEAGAEPARTLMVGDSSVDIKTARNAGVGSVGCTWGFQPEGLVAEPPDYLIENMTELLTIVAGASNAII